MKVAKHLKTLVVLGWLPLLSVSLMARAEDNGKPRPKEPATEHRIISGRFDTVDAANASVTLSNKKGDSKTVAVTTETKIEVNGKPATLADIKVGMYGGAKLAADGNTALMLRANQGGGKDQHVIFSGRFTAVDAAQSTVSLAGKDGARKTVSTNAQTHIEVNGKPATLADVQVGMYGGVKMAADGTTVLMVRAQSPK